MHSKQDRPILLFTIVQIMGIAAIAIVALAMLSQIRAALSGALLPLLCLTGALGCLLWMLAEFVSLCGRVKQRTAFTPANAQALGRIALAFTAAGMLLIPSGGTAMEALTAAFPGAYHPLMAVLPSFGAFAAALLVRAIQQLLRRAVEMQVEQDLTV